MSRIKSLVGQVKVDKARKAHNCRRSKSHRIERGDKRLKVRDGRSWIHYCRGCGAKIIDKDIEKLQSLRGQLLSE